MIDWTLARRVAGLASGSDEPPGPAFDLAAACREMEPYVAAYTGLVPEGPVPFPEVVTRPEWASVNLDTLALVLDPVAARLEARLSSAGPLAGPLRAALSAALAAECGLVMGYVSQRVIGQYDVSLLGGDAPPRLLFVAPNLTKAVRELEVDADPFQRWICAHELTHVFQFQGVPWLRGHLSEMIRSYLATVEVRVQGNTAGALAKLGRPAELVESFRQGGLAALVQSPEQQGLLDTMQAVMAVIEGYGEHVMDAIAAEAIPGHERLREAMDRRRRSRSAPERLVERLLGLDIKLRQYELGKRFCDAVVKEAGIEGLNVVWRAPEMLPSARELEHPGEWLDRTGPGRAAAA